VLKRILILFTLVLALTQAGCTIEDGGAMYQPYPLSIEGRQKWEQIKRDFLKIEDVKIGNGPIAARGRKISADIEVRYSDGTLVYQGPGFSFWGMQGDVFIHNNLHRSGTLSLEQTGIILGLNGMAVGGKRRITLAPKLVCQSYGTEEADPKIACGLVGGNRKEDRGMAVRKETLVVEATLTDSCVPAFLYIPMIYSGEFRCRASEAPQRDPSAPTWRLY